MPKPFIKWVGGKRALMPYLLAAMPRKWNKETNGYYEPFLGGGALFFELLPKISFLSDINAPLINTYIDLRTSLKNVVFELSNYEILHGPDLFQMIRSKPITTAAQFIYLNASGFNGLYRVNKKGGFNVPYGKRDSLPVDYDALLLAYLSLQGRNIACHTYDNIDPQPGDLVYFDPPYYGTFSGYDGSGFTDADQDALALFARELWDRGVYVMLSNSDDPYIRDLYDGFNFIQVDAQQTFAGPAENRGRRAELIITNYKP